jgi:hypothetical protein
MELPQHLLLLTILMASVEVHQATDKLKTMNLEHFSKVHKFKCKEPQPRLIPVEDLFKVNSKDLYIPKATVLYRCGEDTGCCLREDMTCVPHKMETVTLVFNVHDTEYHNNSMRELQATNHTLCWCADLNETNISELAIRR